MSGSAHAVTNFTKPEFQFHQIEGLPSVLSLLILTVVLAFFGVF